MLTGRGTFEGRTVSDVLASVIKSEPEWKRLPSSLHPRIRLMLERCLEKETRTDATTSRTCGRTYKKLLRTRRLIRAAGCDSGISWEGADDPSVGCHRYAFGCNRGRSDDMEIQANRTEASRALCFRTAGRPAIQRSRTEPCSGFPDGTQVAYSTNGGIYLRSIDELEARLIPGTERDTQQPFFSPDGKWLGYWSPGEGRLRRLP